MSAQQRRSRQTECDECGKRGVGIHRVDKGHRYCGTCYKRVFTQKNCPRCRCPARLPKNAPGAICRSCEKDKPCARCGKARYRLGRLTAYGPVCNACSVYFRTPEPCDSCGAPSKRLSRAAQFPQGHRVCPQCASATHASCEACHRHRKLVMAPSGQHLCRKCLEHGEIPCPECGDPMPAGYGNRCADCYWRGLVNKRMDMNTALFETHAMAVRFREFGAWLAARQGPNRAALRINRYANFFKVIEGKWGEFPNYKELITHFGPDGLRRYRLLTDWLAETGFVKVDRETREVESERRQIHALLGRLPARSRIRTLAESYLHHLEQRRSKKGTSLRSIRLALAPAVHLLTIPTKQQRSTLSQADLELYLRRKPGQWAALTGFVNHLRQHSGCALRMPKRPATRNKRAALEARILDLMGERATTAAIDKEWVRLSLAYFHDLPMKKAKAINRTQVSANSDGSMTVQLLGNDYWIPARPRPA